ncbi:DDB1- and CUL4-associated factor 15 [Ambystoma mexicanum]|uniref:DDB1- and CUL4-associated factor 15 n=1 Tax=Ambystoma mexicanum TaxID=8296 RepID=UPI0037E9B344
MAPGSKCEKEKEKQRWESGGARRGRRRGNVLKQLERVKISGQLSPRLFRKLPPRVCVSLKNIVDEDFLRAGHIFLGFSKCGRYVLSYTSKVLDDDFSFSFYIYHLYWWEFNIHSRLKLARQVRLFQDEEIYSDLYLTVCEWPTDSSKIIVFGFNTSANGKMMDMMSDENHRDIYISMVAMPPPRHCVLCREAAQAHPSDTNAHCLQHGFMLHTKYQVVYPFPTFQPAFQLKKDQVVLLNTSYSLVACAVSVQTADIGESCQVLYERKTHKHPTVAEECAEDVSQSSSRDIGGGLEGSCCQCLDPQLCTRLPHDVQTCSKPAEPSLAIAKAKEFVADIFRRAKEAAAGVPDSKDGVGCPESFYDVQDTDSSRGPSSPALENSLGLHSCNLCHGAVPAGGSSQRAHEGERFGQDSSPSSQPESSPCGDSEQVEPGYVNYTRLRYVLEPVELSEQETEYEDDKISLPFVVTDLRGRNLKPMKASATMHGQYLSVEQLTLDFEYVINEVIRNDAAWSKQFCSFSDYDIVILEVCSETNQVIINIGLLLLAFPAPDEEGQLRPKTYHTSLKVAWDLNTGVFITVSVGDLTEVKGQTSGSVWSAYRKSCVDMVMKWLVPESSGRCVNRMTNEALHKGCSLKFLADNVRYTWIVL